MAANAELVAVLVDDGWFGKLDMVSVVKVDNVISSNVFGKPVVSTELNVGVISNGTMVSSVAVVIIVKDMELLREAVRVFIIELFADSIIVVVCEIGIKLVVEMTSWVVIVNDDDDEDNNNKLFEVLEVTDDGEASGWLSIVELLDEVSVADEKFEVSVIKLLDDKVLDFSAAKLLDNKVLGDSVAKLWDNEVLDVAVVGLLDRVTVADKVLGVVVAD